MNIPLTAARAIALGAALLAAPFAHAQTTGEIYGKATDKSGAVVPGVTVTISSPVLLQAQSAVTSGTGVYRFPALPIGSYSVRFELSGFTTVVREGVRLEIGQNAQINATLDVSALQEVVTITGEAPLIDTRDNTRVSRFNQEALQNIPSARDPWVILQQSAGIVMDRENIGGNMSGQQSNFVARGAATTQQKWNLDGIDITDMSATGASPVYYDFDAFEEMQISTGGADVTMQSPGVGVNLVTKSGTDKFKGSARYYVTDEKFQSTNVTTDLRLRGATSGNPIQNIKDYGGEMGGPLVKGKLWAWGSYGTQDINVGVNNFFLRNSACDAAVRVPPAPNAPASVVPAVKPASELALVPFDTIKDCLATDLTKLVTYNAKVNYQVAKNTQISLFFNAAKKDRNARDASDLRPIETAVRQGAVNDETLGSKLWKTGIPKTYKASLRHIFSDRFMMEFQYAHVGNNFTLDFQEPALANVQSTFEIGSSLWGRSFNASNFVRPTNSFDLTGTRSSSGFLGGDHAIKFGVRYRQDRAISKNHRGGNVEARWRDANGDRTFQSSEAAEANLYRDSYTDYNVFDTSAYLQDTFTRGRFTLMAGLRYDRQWDRTNESRVNAHPFFGQTTRTGLAFNHLPAINFAGADPGVTFNDVAPRVGMNFDLTGDGRSVVKANYARYYSQLGDGDLAGTLNPVQASFVRYPWTDLNGDLTVQPGEVNISGTALTQGGNYNPLNPTALTSPGTVDPNLSNERVDELILAYDRQFGNSFAVGVAAIYRKYGNFRKNDLLNWTSANYRPVSFTPNCSAVPAAQNPQCPTVTYYEPTSTVPTAYLYTNVADGEYSREYRGLELTFRKRTSGGLMLNGSFSYNDNPLDTTLGLNNGQNPSALNPSALLQTEDPTNVVNFDQGQYAPVSAGSGLDNVFISSRWLARLSASYTIPWQKIGVAMFFNARDGYPNPIAIQTPSRPNGGGISTVYLAPLGSNRLESFHNLDLRIDKTVSVQGRANIVISADVFNALNNDTVQSIRRIQTANNANLISAIVAPRVVRFGARLTW